MANIPRIRSPGLWVPGSVVLQEEFEAFDEIRPWLINAADGSTHAPTVQIVLGGQGLRVSGPSRLDSITLAATAATGTITIVDNSTLIINGGAVGGRIRVDTGAVPGRIDLDGAGAELRVKTGTFINVQAGGALDVYGGATLKSTGVLTAANASNIVLSAGSTTTSNGNFFFATSTWPKLSPARNWDRRSLTIAVCSGTTTVASTPNGSTTSDSWKVLRGSIIDRIFAQPTISSAAFTLVEFGNLPQGGVMSSCAIISQGATAATVTMTFPTYEFIRWNAAGSAAMSVLVPDVHVIANWTSEATTTIPITSNATIDNRFRYGLVIHHCFGASIAEGSTYYADCVAVGSSTDIEV